MMLAMMIFMILAMIMVNYDYVEHDADHDGQSGPDGYDHNADSDDHDADFDGQGGPDDHDHDTNNDDHARFWQ